MATINTKGFDDLNRLQAAAIQGRASGLQDLTTGSVLLAVVEAVSLVVMWLQSLLLNMMTLLRASTSAGSDLDSFFADFGFLREPATFATGIVTFGRFATTAVGLVQVGASVSTEDGSQQYIVVIDDTNPAYSGLVNGYQMNVGVGTVDVPVTALAAGEAGNAIGGAVNTISSAIVGVDTVTNASALSNGLDPESDPAFRARFVLYLQGLSKGTLPAIEAAVSGIQQGVNLTVTENFTYAGAAQSGHFSVVVDDGSGSPSGGFLSTAANVVESVRPLTSTYEVNGPIVTNAAITMNVHIAAGATGAVVQAAIQAAITAYIDGLGLGNALRYTRLIQVAYDASTDVTDVYTLTINGGTSDILPDTKHTVRCTSVTTTVV